MLWQEQTWPVLEQCAREGYLVLLPCGAMEQHGHHLPVDTDTDIVTTVAQRAAERMERVLVLPTLWLGLSQSHMMFTGTITFSMETYGAVIADIARCVAKHGFTKLVLLNGHGGNDAFLRSCSMGLLEEIPDLTILAFTYWHLAREAFEGVRDGERGSAFHSGELETSCELALRPHLVHPDKYTTDLEPPPLRHMAADLMDGGFATMSRHNRRIYPTGVTGDPTLGTADKGEAVLEASAVELARYLTEFQELNVYE